MVSRLTVFLLINMLLEKDIKMIYILLMILFTQISCSKAPESENTKKWFSIIQNTQWYNEFSGELNFDSTGEKAQDFIITYTYYNSPTIDTGTYFTQVEIQPIHWFLFKKENFQLIQYGPFLYSNDVTSNTNLLTIWIQK